MAWNRIFRSDTGEWDLTELCGNLVSAGRLSIQRVDQVTFLVADNLRIAQTAGSSIDLLPAGTVPAGLRPARSRWENVITSKSKVLRIAVSPSGWVPLYLSPEAGDVLHFTLSYPTPGAMPTTIPGVKL